MSLQNIPDIYGIDPAAVRTLTRLCSGPPGPGDPFRDELVQAPRLVDIGEDVYVIFTDASTAVLIRLDTDHLPEEIEAGPSIQKSFNQMLTYFEGDHVQYSGTVDAATLIAWCAKGTEKCPRCKGTKTCMFPRLPQHASRENPDILGSHEGEIGIIFIDRRRITLPFQMLGIDEGEIDLQICAYPGEVPITDPATGARTMQKSLNGVVLSGDGWRVYSAGIFGDYIKPDIPIFPL